MAIQYFLFGNQIFHLDYSSSFHMVIFDFPFPPSLCLEPYNHFNYINRPLSLFLNSWMPLCSCFEDYEINQYVHYRYLQNQHSLDILNRRCTPIGYSLANTRFSKICCFNQLFSSWISLENNTLNIICHKVHQCLSSDKDNHQ